ncbi:Uncharacterised protein [Mycobacteroides abscessus subsp. abscessus]|nr:Uncharacterised protein [Mycobacteroides abscessus subsp. abscessus]
MSSAPIGATAPQAGVMPTNAAISPELAPSEVARPVSSFSTSSHAHTPAHAAAIVFSTTTAALLPAASAEPPLKPNQPKNRMPEPSMVSGRLCGRGGFGKVLRLPSTSTSASAAMPALMCTAVPPAKSTAFRVLAIQPPATAPSAESKANTQCATGKYTSAAHTPANSIHAPNFIRSATAPEISATVMAANSNWNPDTSAGGNAGSAGAASNCAEPRNSSGSPSRPSPPSESPSTAE